MLRLTRMYVLCLIDFEQTAGLSWVCVLTFHIFRLFLIFLALLYICNKLLGLCVRKKKGVGAPFCLIVLFLFLLVLIIG